MVRARILKASGLIVGLVMVVGILAGCGTPGPTPVPPTPTPTLKGKVDIGGYSLYIQCEGEGSPTVVMDHGSGTPWTPRNIVDGVKSQTRICYYWRAGMGTSDPSPKKPRTSGDMMKELHTLLTNAHIAGPYVLVGHSIAGLNVRVYANLYPQEVVGMVMIDPAHPDLYERLLAALPPESADDPAALKDFRTAMKVGWFDFGEIPAGEYMDQRTSAAEARACGSLGDIPLVVLSAAEANYGGLPGDLEQKLQQEWNAMGKELSQLSSNGTFVLAEKSGHTIHYDEPQLVIDAILKVVADARK
jgi:pimeloyl-ACP methyl ester carboxylesterase